MARFLIATLPIPGHVAPMASIARALVDAGHSVRWYTGRDYQRHVETSGARFLPILSALDYGDSDYNRHFPGRERYHGLAQIKFDFKHVFADAAPGYVKDIESILDAEPADVLLGDPATIAVRIVGERRSLPWSFLNITVLGIPGRDVAPFGLGLLPDATPLGRVRNAALYWLARNVVFRDVNQHFAQIAKEGGWPAFPFEPTVSPYLYLQPSVPAFEYPRSDLPSSVHFIGPVLPSTPVEFTPPPWWGEILERRRPVVLLTQGTIATDPGDLLVPAMQGLAGEDVLVVATTTGTTVEALGVLPENVRTAPFIPFGKIMPHASALVTNGGYGGVSIALSHGVPVVTAGSSEDKPEVGNRVTVAGVGVRLKSSAPAPEAVQAAVRSVLGTPSYRVKARVMRVEIARYDAPREAVRLLEQLATTRQPVLRSNAVAAIPEPQGAIARS
jgi:UDP:flavonoid glycosyltransferase YjiC (YdhE family)